MDSVDIWDNKDISFDDYLDDEDEPDTASLISYLELKERHEVENSIDEDIKPDGQPNSDETKTKEKILESNIVETRNMQCNEVDVRHDEEISFSNTLSDNDSEDVSTENLAEHMEIVENTKEVPVYIHPRRIRHTGRYCCLCNNNTTVHTSSISQRNCNTSHARKKILIPKKEKLEHINKDDSTSERITRNQIKRENMHTNTICKGNKMIPAQPQQAQLGLFCKEECRLKYVKTETTNKENMEDNSERMITRNQIKKESVEAIAICKENKMMIPVKQPQLGLLCRENCRYNCDTQFPVDKRKRIFADFHKLDQDLGNSLLYNGLTFQNVAHHSKSAKQPKTATFKYKIIRNKTTIPVCKVAFSALYGVGEKRIGLVQRQMKKDIQLLLSQMEKKNEC